VAVHSKVRMRHFVRSGEIGRNALENRIQELVESPNPDVLDSYVVALLVMYLITTILFPQSSGSVPVHFSPM
jgi:hypothetical protein